MSMHEVACVQAVSRWGCGGVGLLPPGVPEPRERACTQAMHEVK